jgi:hypothetical protein
MRRNANGARDLFAPVQVGKEVLTKSLASHGWNSVAGARGRSVVRSGCLGLESRSLKHASRRRG